MTPFVIIEDRDIDRLEGGRMDAIYQADDQYFELFKEEVRKLQAEKSQSITISVFQDLTGSRCKMRRRQVTSIPITPETTGMASPVTVTDAQATTMLPMLVQAIPKLLISVPVTDILLIVKGQLGSS